MEERVILVTEEDDETGTMEKMQAHREGVLHRAFSVFIVDRIGPACEMLIQRRAMGKYHSPGLWTNACCSHPRPGESVRTAASRRLREELDFEVPLEPLGSMLYRADVGGGLVEHEYDHLFLGRYARPVQPVLTEASDARYVLLTDLEDWMRKRPEDFTQWFHLAMPRVTQELRNLDVAPQFR